MSIENENQRYGVMPVFLGNFPLKISEMMAYLYLPIQNKGELITMSGLEPRLYIFWPLIKECLHVIYQNHQFSANELRNRYVYLTVKNLFVTADNPGNRPGWHTDGFMTDDLNFIWSDSSPTVFNTSEFNITPDHEKSIEEFAKQALPENDRVFNPGDLLLINPYVVHRTPTITKPGMRCFFKLSISRHQYNLAGNSINKINKEWKFFDRQQVRNDPHFNALKDADFIPTT